MTSKNLFFKMVRQDFKKRIWCPLLLFVAFFLFLEVRMLITLDSIERYPKSYAYDMAAYVCDHFFGKELAVLAVAVCAAAFLCAVSGFAYMHSKVQTDMYYSLPVSRSEFFWAKYVSGILQFFLPFLMHVLACVGIAAGKKVLSGNVFSAVLASLGVELLVFILAYSVSVLAAGLTGNIIIGILGTGFLFTYSTIIAVLVNLLFHKFLRTYVVYGNIFGDLINDRIWCFSPASMIIKLFTDPEGYTAANAGRVCKYNADYIWVLFLAAAVYSLLAYAVYLGREAEAAGRMIAFGVAEPVIKTLAVIPAAFYSGLFFSEISPDTNSDKWFVFGLVFGYVVLACVLEMIFRADIRGMFRHKKQFLFNAACTALIFMIVKNDVLGYNTYVPEEVQLQSCAVSIEGLMPLAQRISIWNGGSYYNNYNEYRMKYMEIQGNSSVMELARKAAKNGLTYKKFDYYDGIEDSPAYLEAKEKEKGYRDISFGYRFLNGKTVYRRYTVDITDADTLRLISDIFNDYDYKIGSVPLFREGWNEEYTMVRCSNNWKTGNIRLTPAVQSKLLETYQTEYMKLRLDTVMETPPAGTICFLTDEDLKDGYYYAVDCSEPLLVYPQFVQTIALLEEHGFSMNEPVTAEEVVSVTVRDHFYDDYDTEVHVVNEHDGTADRPGQTEYTDKAQIQKILDSIIDDGVRWQLAEYTDFYEERYSVYIEYGDKVSGLPGYSFMTGKVPDFIMQ